MIITALLTTAIVLIFTYSIGSHGIIKVVGLECDTSEINWGTLAPNDTAIATINVWSNGTTPITNLTLSVGSWQPANAANYITITWNYTGALITSTPTPITFTLHVSANVTGISTFSNAIVITAQS